MDTLALNHMLNEALLLEIGDGLDSIAERLEQAQPGSRNNTLNRVAFRLGQIIAGGELEEAEVESLLIDGAMSLGLGEREAIATVHSGMHAGESAPRVPARSGQERITPEIR